MTVRTIDEIFRDFVTDGIPASGPFNPYKPDIRDTLKALTEGSGSFPDNRVIRLNNANAGTANNIVVTASVAIPAAAYQVLYILNVTQENTGPVVVSGAINRTLVTNTNQPLAAGYVTPGMAVLCIDTGSTLRMLSYGDVESVVEDILVRAEAAKDAAELARDQAQNAASDAVSQGNVPIYSTRNSVEGLSIPAGISALRTNGYNVVGDGGSALYKRVSTEPTHSGKVRSADGSWWELAVSRPTPEIFGAKGDGTADDTLAIRDFFANRMQAGYLPQGQRYRVTGTTDIPSGFNLYSDGATILATTSNIVQLRSVDTSDVIVKGRLIVKGPGKANSGGIGLRLGGNSRCLFSGVSIRDIDGWGFYISGGAYDAVSWYDKNQFADCSAYNCYTGREDTPNTLPNLSNEYSTWMDFHAGGCVVGNKTSAGNNSFIGGKLIGNDYNLSIAQGANSAHGTFTGVQINHAGVDNLVCVGASSGLLFVGCTFFGDSPTVGSLRFSNSRGIILSGCLVEASIFSDGAFNSIILDGYYTNNNFVPIHGGTHPQTIYKKNGFDTGGRHAFADEGYDYVSAYRSTNQALTSGADTVIVYDTISNSKNLRGKYNPANGQYTAPWPGVYRVSASMKLTGTVSGGGIKLRRGTGDLAYAGLTDYSGVKVATITADIYCNAGDVITAVANVTGTSLNVSPAPNANLTILAL